MRTPNYMGASGAPSGFASEALGVRPVSEPVRLAKGAINAPDARAELAMVRGLKGVPSEHEAHLERRARAAGES